MRYVDGDDEASVWIRGVKFVFLKEIDEECYKIITGKSRVSGFIYPPFYQASILSAPIINIIFFL